MLRVEGLNTHYGRAHILQDMGLEIGAGEVRVLLGRNGAGKSTTMKSVIGLVRPTSGHILFGGQEIAGEEPHRIARRGLGYVPEDRRVFADRSGLAAARSTRDFLIQAYNRDMGDGRLIRLKEVDAPLMVNGRHWGAVRIAYTT